MGLTTATQIEYILQGVRCDLELTELLAVPDYNDETFMYRNIQRGPFGSLTAYDARFYPITFKWKHSNKYFIMKLNPIVDRHESKSGGVWHELNIQAMLDELVFKIKESY